MNRYRGKSLADTVSAAGSMILFLIFAACMLIIIAAAAGAYSRISESYGTAFSSSAAVKYVTNKIRSFDSCEIYGDGILLESGGIYCLIWCEDGGLYEKTSGSGIPAKTGGDKIFDADALDFSERDGIYTIAVTSGKERRTSFLRKGA